MATTERGTRTRQAILVTAADMFAERGFFATSMSELLDRVGVTRGAFYFHFETKDELAQEVCRDYQNWLTGLQREVADREPEPLRRVPKVLLETSLRYRTDPIARATTRLLEESNQLSLPHLMPVWVPWWADTLGEAERRHQLLDGVDVPALAWLLPSAFYGSQVNSFSETRWADLPGRLRDLLRFMLLPWVAPEPARVLAADLHCIPTRAEQAEQTGLPEQVARR